MKMRFILSVLISVLLISCSSSKTFKSHSDSIQLKGNPTTGYSWYYTIDDESLVSIEENVEYLGADGVCGAPSMFTYTINSLKEGETTLHFVYKRHWEKDSEIDFKDYLINIDSSGTIKITE